MSEVNVTKQVLVLGAELNTHLSNFVGEAVANARVKKHEVTVGLTNGEDLVVGFTAKRVGTTRGRKKTTTTRRKKVAKKVTRKKAVRKRRV